MKRFSCLTTRLGAAGVVFVWLVFWSLAAGELRAGEKVLTAHIRHRPPYMIVQGEFLGGSLKEILDLAARRLGYRVDWRDVPFSKSIEELKTGRVDIVPGAFPICQRASNEAGVTARHSG
ncbi:MAG: hypothetical protein HQM02_08485 [Magnetococcales bacterium]|nr:hypothetical protein [Magnetococcales bacterium]